MVIALFVNVIDEEHNRMEILRRHLYNGVDLTWGILM